MNHDQSSAVPSRNSRFSFRRLVRLIRGRKSERDSYTKGPIAGTMLRTALVMLPGTLTISGYNLVDAYFVGQLEGDAPMAAIGLTAPLVMICGCFFHGLSAGVMTTTAQSLGGKRRWRAEQLVSTGLFLVTLVSLSFAIIGPLVTRAVYRNVMHASPEATRLATSYMDIWFWACVTSALGMSGNNLLVTANDSKMASATMVLGLASNAFLDPLFMFQTHVGSIPVGFGLGVVGAAWATVMAQIIGTTPVLAILWRKHHLIRFRAVKIAKLASLWKRIISFAIPACLGSLMLPIGQFIMTWITSHFGDVVIGAITAAQRVQVIAFFFPMSLGVSLMPMIGQNYGARLYSRINGCRRFAMRFAFFYLMSMSVLFCFFAPEIAAKFLSDADKAEMRSVMTFALRILPWGFAFLEIHRYSGFFFTGCGRPMAAALLNVMRILGFLVPLSLLVLLYFRLTGNEGTALTLLLSTQMGSDVLAGTIALLLARRLTRRFPADGESEDLPPPRRLFRRTAG